MHSVIDAASGSYISPNFGHYANDTAATRVIQMSRFTPRRVDLSVPDLCFSPQSPHRHAKAPRGMSFGGTGSCPSVTLLKSGPHGRAGARPSKTSSPPRSLRRRVKPFCFPLFSPTCETQILPSASSTIPGVSTSGSTCGASGAFGE
jgi:hypothetical protein